jgi:DNA repair exonuclease SbcCD ATPase subunit
MPKEIDMNNEEHTARKQNERIKDKEIARLRQQIAEFAQERGNFARTIFELRGIIEQAANEAQIHEIGSLRDHSYKQADRIKELQEQIEAYRNYGSIKQKKDHQTARGVEDRCAVEGRASTSLR